MAFGAKTSTTTVAAETVFLDTSVIVPASVDGHPSHSVAKAYLASLVAEEALLCPGPIEAISPRSVSE